MSYLRHLFTVLVVLLFLVPVAIADWDDDFDSYSLGGLHGNGGWVCWENNPAFDAYIVNTLSLSSPNCVEITPTTDIVQEFSETSGQWTATGWNYIPSGSTGCQYYILLNTYSVGGPYDWSLDMEFNSSTGLVSTVEGTASTSIIYDQWVEIKVEINLTTDFQNIYYNGVFLDSFGWSGTGVAEIAALDLFSDGGSSIYWDDCSLIGPGALDQTTWGQIKASVR